MDQYIQKLSDFFEFCKLEIFIPEFKFRELQKVLQELDAGHIGNYDSCLSFSRVTGTWRPLENTNPYKGIQGEISEEEELKVEVTCRVKNLDEIIKAIKKIHPYEEPVINAIPILKTGL